VVIGPERQGSPGDIRKRKGGSREAWRSIDDLTDAGGRETGRENGHRRHLETNAMSRCRISVIITSYNMGAYLPETLESALAQSHCDREIIVIDDGSTDDTADRIEPYKERIRYVRQDNAGIAAARNHAVRIARGDYVALLDADDLWVPEKLETQSSVCAAFPECGLIFCNGVMFEGREIIRPSLLSQYWLARLAKAGAQALATHAHKTLISASPISCPAQTLIPRRVVDAVGPFEGDRACDYDYYLRIAQCYPIAFHGHSLVRYRFRSDSMSGPWKDRNFDHTARIDTLRRHYRRCANESDREAVLRSIRHWSAPQQSGGR
jgi:glycosyltransferase involved in cell wall biosynthesis